MNFYFFDLTIYYLLYTIYNILNSNKMYYIIFKYNYNVLFKYNED
jgi:hypothetical protein